MNIVDIIITLIPYTIVVIFMTIMIFASNIVVERKYRKKSKWRKRTLKHRHIIDIDNIKIELNERVNDMVISFNKSDYKSGNAWSINPRKLYNISKTKTPRSNRLLYVLNTPRLIANESIKIDSIIIKEQKDNSIDEKKANNDIVIDIIDMDENIEQYKEQKYDDCKQKYNQTDENAIYEYKSPKMYIVKN